MTKALLHAACVAVNGRGVLILGASGAGKSALALQLIALGAALVADDQTEITAQNQELIATCPASISGKIEARGVGILHSPACGPTPISLVIDLDQPETDRLPPHRRISLLDVTLPLVLGSQSNHFPASVLCYLKGTRLA
ncbi:HPr kinase/phosphorylase [Cypionkella aquatica]|uniref:HPr kinase/phosphorylase n=1 Tax=Cypionkella aquatica TaxID=1756042 RepID=UPI0024E05241|nr:HPr kinase/phosphatase C-terminal domain-containing protein [Cypionkella aquatica]